MTYYKVNEIDTFQYVKLPKELFKNERYRSLSLGARVTYAFLRDRLTLSQMNGWCDHDGNVFLLYGRTELADDLGVSARTAGSYMAELVKVGLIYEERQGQGKPNRIYVCKMELRPVQEFQTGKKLTSRAEEVELSQNGKNFTSKHENSSLLNRKKLRPNKTERNKTEKIHTDTVPTPSATAVTVEEISATTDHGKHSEEFVPSFMEQPSKFVKGKVRKKAGVDEVVAEAMEKSVKVREQKMRKTPVSVPKEKKPRKVPQNCHTLLKYFGQRFYDTFEDQAPLVAGKDQKHLKDLIDHYGYDTTRQMVDWMFDNWHIFRREKKIQGVPTVGLLYGFRAYLQEKIMYTKEENTFEDSAW